VLAVAAAAATAVPGLEALPGLWSLTPIGGFLGVVALVFIGLSTGMLYTRRSHLEVVGLLKDALKVAETSRDTWKAAYDETSTQLGEVVGALGIIPDFFSEVDAIRDESPPEGGDGDAAPQPRPRRPTSGRRAR